MTTIIYDHKTKQVAVDGRAVAGNDIMCENYDKTLKKNDELWFITGSLSERENIVNWKHGDKIENDFSVSAIFIKKGKAYLSINVRDSVNISELTFNDSAGSGAYFALAALDFGKTAKEAVEYAATKDCYTGGKVRVFDVNTGLEVGESPGEQFDEAFDNLKAHNKIMDK